MSELFGDDYISITDDEGNDYDLEVLGRVEYSGAEYLIVTLADPADEQEELEVSILRVELDDGEEILCTVEDEGELEAVYELFCEADDEEELE